jgi:hypothetical protein
VFWLTVLLTMGMGALLIAVLSASANETSGEANAREARPKKTIETLVSGETIRIEPGHDDGTADFYARGDAWFLRYRAAELDDGGKTVVYTKTETKKGLAGAVEWRDVYLKREGRDTINVSNCDGVNCGQPSVSQNGRWVAYVKAAP